MTTKTVSQPSPSLYRWQAPAGNFERLYLRGVGAAWIEEQPDGCAAVAGVGVAQISLRRVEALAGVGPGTLYRALCRGLAGGGHLAPSPPAPADAGLPAAVLADINEDGPKKGTYAAYKVSRDTAASIVCWARAQGLAHIMRPSHMHTTTVYSRRPINYVPSSKAIGAKFEKFHLFPADDGECTLVALVHSPALVDRWATAMRDGASYDFPDYLPHVSLGRVPSNFDLKTLDPFPFPILYSHEFAQMTRPASSVEVAKGYSIGHELMLLAGADNLWQPVSGNGGGRVRRLGVPATWDNGGPTAYAATAFVQRTAKGGIRLVHAATAETAWGADLYYLQPDGRWRKGGDGRSAGRTRAELPKNAVIATGARTGAHSCFEAPAQALAGVPEDSWTQEIVIRVRAHENVRAVESLLRQIEDDTKGGSGTTITVETGSGKTEFYMDGDGGDCIEVAGVRSLNGGAR